MTIQEQALRAQIEELGTTIGTLRTFSNELEKENCELLGIIQGKDKVIQELQQQIDKMKCCGNCKNGELSAHEEPCLHCQRCFASADDVKDRENVSDKWELLDD